MEKVNAQKPLRKFRVTSSGQAIKNALSWDAPCIICGTFGFKDEQLERAPAVCRGQLRQFVGWTVIVFAIPIKDQALWMWHKVGAEASTLACRAVSILGAASINMAYSGVVRIPSFRARS